MGYEVKHIMNITDVGHLTLENEDSGEDKMEKGSRREGKTVWEVAEFYTQAFTRDMEALNIIRADEWTKATDYIAEQIKLVRTLEQKGFTYRISDGIYFDTGKDPHYGKMARLDKAGLEAGARVEINPEKRNITDFALWKFSTPNEKRQMEWPSPWGAGFPGWHIECSAMAMAKLGDTLDIHCGGVDHIPVHHTNEIAQSENATGKPFSRWWMHGEFLNIITDKGAEEKMSKSKDNFLTLELLKNKGFEPLAYRFMTLGAHYRSKMQFSWTSLEASQTAYKKLKHALSGIDSIGNIEALKSNEYHQKFLSAIEDDLNMPQVLALVWDTLKSDLSKPDQKALILEWDKVMGLGLDQKQEKTEVPQEIMDLAAKRAEARANKNWKQSDSLRDQILAKGYKIEDMGKGYRIEKV